MEAPVHLTDAHHPPAGDRTADLLDRISSDEQSAQGIVDPGPLADLEDTELAASLVELFFEAATEQLRELDGALEARDSGRVRALAHRLQGSAASLGALAVSGLCQAVEEAARAGRTSETYEAARQLPEAVAATRSALTMLLAAGAR